MPPLHFTCRFATSIYAIGLDVLSVADKIEDFRELRCHITLPPAAGTPPAASLAGRRAGR